MRKHSQHYGLLMELRRVEQFEFFQAFGTDVVNFPGPERFNDPPVWRFITMNLWSKEFKRALRLHFWRVFREPLSLRSLKVVRMVMAEYCRRGRRGFPFMAFAKHTGSMNPARDPVPFPEPEPLVRAICRLGEWHGTSSALLDKLDAEGPFINGQAAWLAGGPRDLSCDIRRLDTELRSAGMCVEFRRAGVIHITTRKTNRPFALEIPPAEEVAP